MNFALVTLLLRSKAVRSIQSRLARWVDTTAVPAAQVHLNARQCTTELTPRPAVNREAVDVAASSRLQVRRPLRVVRVMESGQPRAHVGRMVISGRMADVCAELDRLAAREAAEGIAAIRMTSASC